MGILYSLQPGIEGCGLPARLTLAISVALALWLQQNLLGLGE
jgi:hypothetical protein